MPDGYLKRIDPVPAAPIHERVEMLLVSTHGVSRQAKDARDIRDVIVHMVERPLKHLPILLT